MVLKFEIDKVRNFLIFSMLFLAAMNFQSKFFYFVFGSVIAMAAFRRYLIADPVSLIYLALGGWMAVYNYDEGALSMIRCFAPFCFYIVGMNLTTDNNKKPYSQDELKEFNKWGYLMLIVISVGSFSHYLMNFIYNFGHNLGRNTNDIWTGSVMAATVQNALAALMIGLALAMFFLPKKKWYLVASALILLLILSYNLILSSRTLFVIILILSVVGFAYVRLNKLSSDNNKIALFAGLICVLAIGIAFAFNVGGIKDYLFDSLLFSRFDSDSLSALLDDGTRTNAKLGFIKEGYKYPMGGLHLRAKYSFAHDLLLDGYDEYGIIALLLMIGMLITGIKSVFDTVKTSVYSHEFRLSLLLIYIAVLLEFTVEPIIEGMPWLFACFSLINGCASGLNRSYIRRSMNSNDESVAD